MQRGPGEIDLRHGDDETLYRRLCITVSTITTRWSTYKYCFNTLSKHAGKMKYFGDIVLLPAVDLMSFSAIVAYWNQNDLKDFDLDITEKMSTLSTCIMAGLKVHYECCIT